ncbi:hypothetical protein [Lysinibacillus fusiformis]|uniref:hypothetical protein n=1 Tax=Lysinibacillus fusiformis TaxID=28031 RepID=UPI003D04DE82
MKFCPKCGTKRFNVSNFCHECGEKFVLEDEEEIQEELEPNFVLLDKDGKTVEQRQKERLAIINKIVSDRQKEMENTKSYKLKVAANKAKESTKEFFTSDQAKENYEKGKEAAKVFADKAGDAILEHLKEHGVDYAKKIGKAIFTKKPPIK